MDIAVLLAGQLITALVLLGSRGLPTLEPFRFLLCCLEVLSERVDARILRACVSLIVEMVLLALVVSQHRETPIVTAF